jgi:S-adenosylmethionine:tRNA ribosyltransferase-isomerase
VKVSDFDFELPHELIAQEAAPRGASRLLVLNRASGEIAHTSVRELPGLLRPADLLVANDTRVFPARLLGHRYPSGGAVECLLLAREQAGDPERPRVQYWAALVHPGQKLKPGSLMRFEGSAGVLMAEILEQHFFGRRRIRLWSDTGDVDSLVDALGHVPLPPYIRRPDTPDDRTRYQTVFASERGSVAAPTAGLHFDDALLERLDRAGVERVTITLHVGYGTFKPVRVEEVEQHVVDPEPYDISPLAAERINAALDAGRRIVAVGTTTTRALEDAALGGGPSRASAREPRGRRIEAGGREAPIFIYPGFEFRVISGLLTNFHLPKSSLLMLVAAFAGRERVLEAYRVAVERRYRFYSYGDAMLIV